VTALKRGLKEYLEQVSIDVAGARIRFQRVFSTWSDTDDVATYPSAVVLAIGDAEYDYASMSPVLDPANKVVDGSVPSGTSPYLVKYAEVAVTLAIEVHCSSAEERIAVSMLLEDVLNPVDWMYGFQLVLPHYFNQRAVYEPVTTQMVDSEDSARRRWRPGTVTLKAHVPLLRVRALPNFDPRVVVEVEDGT